MDAQAADDRDGVIARVRDAMLGAATALPIRDPEELGRLRQSRGVAPGSALLGRVGNDVAFLAEPVAARTG